MLAILLSPIYFLFHAYVCRRLLQWISSVSGRNPGRKPRVGFIIVYFVMALSIAAGAALPSCGFQRAAAIFGNYWLGVTFYEALILLPMELFFFAVKRCGKEKFTESRRKKIFNLCGLAAATIVCGISAYGVINGNILHTTEYEISIDKDGGAVSELNAVLIADLHMGYSVGSNQIADMVEKIQAQNPDIIFVAGDIFDNDYDTIANPDKLISLFQQLSPKYGIYGCWGNHDIDEKIIAGFTFGWSKEAQKEKRSDPRMDEFLRAAGIRLLQDEAVLINDSFYVYGRPDAEKSPDRKTANQAMNSLDLSKPVLVVDHEPKELKELARSGADADFCGHTHDGQLFPLNLTGKLLWENPAGYLKKGDMHSIVTSGVGLYGPDMRVGTKAEICAIKIRFK